MNSKCLVKRLATTAFAAVLSLGASRLMADDLGAPAADGQKYDLKLNIAAGQKWQFSSDTKSDVTTTLNANGQQQQLQQTSDQTRGGTYEILGVKGSDPSSMRIAFDQNCGAKMTQNGQSQDTPSPLAGKTVTVTRGDDGQITNDANADQATAAELEQMLVPDRTIYPKNPVGVGDEWNGDTDALTKQFQLGQGDSVTMKCKLLKIGSLNNVPTADIYVSIGMTKIQNGVPTKLQLVGVAQVDLASGQALACDLVGPLGGGGDTQLQGGVQGHVDINGKLEVHASVKQVGGNPSAAQGATPLAQAPMQQPAPPEQPMQPAAPAADNSGGGKFAGTFKNDKISVALAANPLDGSLTGTIAIGAKNFPAKASVDATGKLVGTFTSDGNSFDFTASVEGTTMTFTSGSASYTLTKPASAVNPLDGGAAPAPRNPLDDGAAPAPPPKPNPLDPQSNANPAPASAVGGVVSGAAGSGPATLVMKKITIPDPMVNCDAGTILIPENWSFQGKMVWVENAFYPVSPDFYVHDTQSLRAMTIYPRGTFCDGIRESAAQTAAIAGPQAMQAAASAYPEGGHYMGSEVRQRMSAVAFIQNIVIPRFRSDLANAQASDPISMPEIAKIKAKTYGEGSGLDVQTVKVRFNYDLEGKPVEEDMYVTIYTSQMPGTNMFFWNTDTESYRADRGQLDQSMPIFRSILSSIKANLQWYNAVAQISQMMQDNIRQSIANAGKISQMITQVNNDISDSIRERYDTQVKSDEKTFNDWDQVVRGVDVYGDGQSSYEVPIGYDHYYKNDQGQILMTSDPHFDPNKGGWTEMQRSSGQ